MISAWAARRALRCLVVRKVAWSCHDSAAWIPNPADHPWQLLRSARNPVSYSTVKDRFREALVLCSSANRSRLNNDPTDHSQDLIFLKNFFPQVRGQGPIFDLWSPQYLVSNDGAMGVDSICTPMMHRKQRSLESEQRPLGSTPGSTTSSSKSNRQAKTTTNTCPSTTAKVSSATTSAAATSIAASDSSPSPKRETVSLCGGADSGTSTLNEREREAALLLRSADSSPHSAGDSGLATTGSRASQDSRTKVSLVAADREAATNNNAEASAAGPLPPHAYDAVPLYSNIDYNYYLDSKAQAHLLPLQQYILEQAKLSGYRFGDSLLEEAGDDVDSLHSDDDLGRIRRNKTCSSALPVRDNNDDSDDFADDEAMSNVEDSSSQEYLDESQYLEEDDHYTQFMLPPVPPQRLQSKGIVQYHQQHNVMANSAQVIVEPEYSEADPGMVTPIANVASGTFRTALVAADRAASAVVPAAKHHHAASIASASSIRSARLEQQLYSPVMDKAGVS